MSEQVLQQIIEGLFCALWNEHKDRTGHEPKKRELQVPFCLTCLTCLHLASTGREIEAQAQQAQVQS